MSQPSVTSNSEYQFEKDGDYLLFVKKGQPLLTPMGSRVRTSYEPLAQRLLEHLDVYGEGPQDPVSIVAFHYSMIDFFATMPREELERSVLSGLKRENDWTFNCPTANPGPMMQWMALFGSGEERIEKAIEWVKSLSLMQLCAVCVIGRAMESVNIPYIVASQLEGKHIKQYAKAVNQFYPYVPVKDMVRYFENLTFYFNVENPPAPKKTRSKKITND